MREITSRDQLLRLIEAYDRIADACRRLHAHIDLDAQPVLVPGDLGIEDPEAINCVLAEIRTALREIGDIEQETHP